MPDVDVDDLLESVAVSSKDGQTVTVSDILPTFRQRILDLASEHERLQDYCSSLALQLQRHASGQGARLRRRSPKQTQQGSPSAFENVPKEEPICYPSVVPGTYHPSAEQPSPVSGKRAVESTEPIDPKGVVLCTSENMAANEPPQLELSAHQLEYGKSNSALSGQKSISLDAVFGVTGSVSDPTPIRRGAVKLERASNSSRTSMSSSSASRRRGWKALKSSDAGMGLHRNFSAGTNLMANKMLPDYVNFKVVDEEANFPGSLRRGVDATQFEPDCGVLLPASPTRMFWDLIVFTCLLFELWATPFELIFCQHDAMPQAIKTTSVVVTGMFFFDMILNFNTGYFVKDKIVLARRAIARNYLRFWFWADLVSTVPWDYFLQSIGGGMLRWVRFGKAMRILRTVRYVKFARSVKLIRAMSKASGVQRISMRLQTRYLATPMQMLLFLCVWSHVHACIWAALHPDWLPASSFSESLKFYAYAFYWAYSAITVGDLKLREYQGVFVPVEQSWLVWSLELLIASERVGLLSVVVIWGVCQAHTHFHDYIRLTKLKTDALEYLKRHKVSFATQVQVLYILHETGNVRQRQRHFRDLMDNDLPVEIKRKICSELWLVRLVSLGLIEEIHKLHDHFLVELALIVREEVFASKAVIFQCGDASIASYYVMDGTLVCVSDVLVPNFTPGQWIGETALVNPLLRRHLTVSTTKITVLMAVPAEGFQDLLTRLLLQDQFRQVCEEHLWKGLCGRCGILGEHNADDCPMLMSERKNLSNILEDPLGSERFHSNDDASHTPTNNSWPNQSHQRSSFLGKVRTSVEFLSRSHHMNKPAPSHAEGLHRDLKQFLTLNQLDRLIPSMKIMGMITLQQLQDCDIEELVSHLSEYGQHLSGQEKLCLSAHAINQFRIKAARTVQRQLFGTRESHYLFLSHSKMEAGTEAALMRTELEQLLVECAVEMRIPAVLNFDVPVFLDTENLANLKDILAFVHKSHNIVVLLTTNVLTRPWVLVEIVTAHQAGLRLVPVKVTKPGVNFDFPDEQFYARLPETLTAEGTQVLLDAGVNLADVESALREMFNEIVMSYSPHRNSESRQLELKSLLKRCTLRADFDTGYSQNLHQMPYVNRVPSIEPQTFHPITSRDTSATNSNFNVALSNL